MPHFLKMALGGSMGCFRGSFLFCLGAPFICRLQAYICSAYGNTMRGRIKLINRIESSG